LQPSGLKKVVRGFSDVAETWRYGMQVKYYAEDDVLIMTASRGGCSGGTLRDDFGVIFTFEGEGSENIARVRVLNITDFLPLGAERGYDADTDTLTLGDKPDADYRVVDNGDFVSYRQWFDDGSEWDVVALDLRQASRHLAQVIAALPQPATVSA
jgi:hypothetical protein